MALTSAGIGSGLDVASIVQNLMTTEQGPLTNVTQQKTSTQAKISAYGSLQSALSSFQTTLGNLSNISKFNALTVQSSDASTVSATATGSATAASHSLQVDQLAQSHKLALAPKTSLADIVGMGTLTIDFGSYDSTGNTFTAGNKAALTINITTGNNTLSGVRDAINAANAGVSASIVNDGTGYRLVLSSKDSGAGNSLRISASDGDGTNTDNSGLSQLAYDPTALAGSGKNLSQVQEAKNALLSIDGISISKASNVITDALEGVTLTLSKVSASPQTLTIGRDTSTVEANVASFVKAYNDLNQTLRNLTKYDEASKTGGALLGDSTARGLAFQLKSVLTQSVGSTGALTSLYQIGVTFQKDGTLALDSSKLKSGMESNFSEIAGLFAATGKATDSQISVAGNSSSTLAGNYAVNVTQLATRGSLAGSDAAGLTITAGVNDAIALNIDGVDYNLTLTAGSYASSSALAAELQNRISAAGSAASVNVNAGMLSVTSVNYGSSSSILLGSANGNANLFGNSAVSSAGIDVAGSINGVAATGKGQNLIGATGDANGLNLKVDGGALGARGTVNFTLGYAYQLRQLADNYLRSDGLLTARTEGLSASVTRLTRQQETLQARLAVIEQRYRDQFTALDTLISSMQSTSSYLSQQISMLQSNS